TSDPTGGWYQYAIDTGPSSTLPDYPLLGYNDKWVVITTNDFFNLFFNSVRISVINKADLLAGTLSTINTFFDASGIFTLSPAETLDAGVGIEYMLVNYNGNSGGSGYVQLCGISGAVNSPVYTAGSVIGVNQTWSTTTLTGKQKGTNQTIDAGTVKMRSVIIRNGSLYASQNISLPATAPTRASAQWWQINPATAAVIQFGRLDVASGKYSATFPSLSVSADNDVLIGFSVFGSPLYASAGYAYRNSTDALNTLRNPVIFKSGESTYYKTYGGSRNRWGDYSATCIDPSDGSFWTLQEYAASPADTWGTWWANVAVIPFTTVNKKAAIVEMLQLSPNPAKNIVAVKWQSVKEGSADLQISDAGGNILIRKNIKVVTGGNQENLQIANLKTGTYNVTLIMKNGDMARSQLIVTK
ncbi:MAG: T9SS type A sorting domain-containing protein, partial [Panacibacter sp.]